MTNIKDIYCLDINQINEQIINFELVIKNMEEDTNKRDTEWNELFIGTLAQIDLLNGVKSQLKPIQPLIENAFNTGDFHGGQDMQWTVGRISHSEFTALDKEDYINTKQFEL